MRGVLLKSPPYCWVGAREVRKGTDCELGGRSSPSTKRTLGTMGMAASVGCACVCGVRDVVSSLHVCVAHCCCCCCSFANAFGPNSSTSNCFDNCVTEFVVAC